MSGVFNKNLGEIDFEPSDSNRSVLLVSALKNKEDLAPWEIFALEDAKKFKATAVYFRDFQNGRSPIPQIYIYDNTDNNLDEEVAEIHRDLWSNSRIPMFIVIEKTDIRIFDARKPVKVSENRIETSPIVPKISIASDAIKQYSRKLFDSGVFWESEKAKGHFLESTSAYTDLIKNLKTVRRDKFIQKANLPKKIANKLLVFSILIKYLEERGNQDEENISKGENGSLFARDFFRKNFDAENFCDVIKQGKIIDLFDELSRHFNGKIFEWADSEERELVQNTNLTELALFLYGDIVLDKGQYSFWRKYSFAHLPIELISSVYEELLNERKDAVYTPEFLVYTLIDESIPQKEYKKTSVKTIDVSCGSGIFLVSAFKRLVQRHRYAKFKETGKFRTLESKELLQIIKANIFGVDIEEDARRLTVFSLCLALCDELTPKEIWTELKFDDTFQTNFTTDNFFTYLESNEDKLGTFDLVIGNPPFKSLTLKKDENGKTIGEYKEENSEGRKEIKCLSLNEYIIQKSRQKLYPNNQTALMFLDQSPRLLKENGLLCLIMPSAPLLYNNSFEFRKYFFPKHQVYQILDFTNLDLFENAKVATAAIFVKTHEHSENQITHITMRRTKSVEDRIFFEIDKYDFHYISQNEALNNKHIWKCNLLGGGRLINLIDRLSSINSIGNYIKSKKQKGWVSNEGYKIGSSNNKKRKKAPFITGKPTLPAEAFDKNGIDKSKIVPQLEEKFHSTGSEKIYHPPHILIKKEIGDGRIPTNFSDNYLTFDGRVVGIHAPEKNHQQLFSLYESFEENKDLYNLFITATSNEFAVGRATSILKQDIMNLPYSENKEEMQLSFVEQILCDDVLDYYIQIKAKSSNAKMNNPAEEKDLKKFGEVFNKMLNSVYGKSGKYFYLKKIIGLNGFFVTEFNYGTTANDVEFEEIDEPTEHIKSLIEAEYGSNAFIIKILKLYERNKIYLIKPKALRYWLRSIALKDADEAFSDSLKAGY